jgi:hypothetical protein
MGLPRLINELNRGYPLRCADPSQAAGYDKRSDKQIDRARVLEVRIHLPPPASLRTFSPSRWILKPGSAFMRSALRELADRGP